MGKLGTCSLHTAFDVWRAKQRQPWLFEFLMKDGELWKGVEPPPPLMAADQSPVMLKDGLLNLGRARHCAESTGARRKDAYAPRHRDISNQE